MIGPAFPPLAAASWLRAPSRDLTSDGAQERSPLEEHQTMQDSASAYGELCAQRKDESWRELRGVTSHGKMRLHLSASGERVLRVFGRVLSCRESKGDE